MPEGELESDGRKGDAVTVADGFDPCASLLDRFGSRLVVVLRFRGRPGGQNPAIEGPADEERHVPLQAEGKKPLDRLLLQQRVSPCEEKAVEISVAEGVIADLPLVHAESDRSDHALGAQIREGAEGPIHGSLEMNLLEFGPEIRCIDIVNESDVDMARAEALKTVLDGPHGCVIAVVQNQPERWDVDTPALHPQAPASA